MVATIAMNQVFISIVVGYVFFISLYSYSRLLSYIIINIVPLNTKNHFLSLSLVQLDYDDESYHVILVRYMGSILTTACTL